MLLKILLTKKFLHILTVYYIKPLWLEKYLIPRKMLA